MAKNKITKSVILLLSLPLHLIAIIAEFFDLWNLKKDINKCVVEIRKYKENNISKNLRDVLVTAEDRRNKIHRGVDPIAMIRAIVVKIMKNEIQGASTIEQQFVRVVSQRYERKFTRKFREQILAILVSKRTTKENMANSYLCIAFYGSGKIGVLGIQKLLGSSAEFISIESAIEIVARLKYPEPLIATKEWRQKFEQRNKYIRYNLSIENRS